MQLQSLASIAGVLSCLLVFPLVGCAAGEGTDPESEPAVAEPGAGPEGCVPTTCDDVGATCGTILDGCGETIACGECTGESTCGGVEPNQCGVGDCTAATCEGLDAQCGQVSDGCADVLQCGSCEGGLTCSAEFTCCVALTTCDDVECGEIDDGCGNVVNCGGCGAGEFCGGGGENTCGDEVCLPGSCATLGADCGAVSDGCSQTLDCGFCPTLQTCGGAGVDNQCGATCAAGCPEGYACDDFGICTGGSASDLVIDLPAFAAVTLNPIITMGGSTPTLRAGEISGCVQVNFNALDERLDSVSAYACSNEGWILRDVTVFHGNYRISVRNDSGVLVPNNFVVVDENRSITGSFATLDLPVYAEVILNPTITMEGAAPTLRPGETNGCVQVNFIALDEGGDFVSAYACSNEGWILRETTLISGNYRVSVRNDSGTLFPDGIVTLDQNRNITGPIETLDLPAFAAVPVAPRMTMSGGGVPTLRAGETDGCVQVSFIALDPDLDSLLAYACSFEGWVMREVTLFNGTYRIEVRNDSGTLIPNNFVTLSESQNIAGPIATLDLPAYAAVSLNPTITMEGGNPTLRAGETSGCVQVSFVAFDDELDFAFAYACSNEGWILRDVTLFSGNYRIEVRNDSGTLFPNYFVTIDESRSITSSFATLDLPAYAAVTLTPLITMDGAIPTLRPGETNGCVQVNFTALDDGLDSVSSYACSSEGWILRGVTLFNGDYRISVRNDSGTLFPNNFITIDEDRNISAPIATLDLPAFNAVTLTPLITMDGATPTLRPGQTIGCVLVSFSALDEGLDSRSAYACSDEGWILRGVTLFNGNYRVSVRNDSGTLFPDNFVTITDRLLIE